MAAQLMSPERAKKYLLKNFAFKVNIQDNVAWPDMLKWLHKTLPRDEFGLCPYWTDGNSIYFDKTEHAVWFTLRWA